MPSSVRRGDQGVFQQRPGDARQQQPGLALPGGQAGVFDQQDGQAEHHAHHQHGGNGGGHQRGLAGERRARCNVRRKRVTIAVTFLRGQWWRPASEFSCRAPTWEGTGGGREGEPPVRSPTVTKMRSRSRGRDILPGGASFLSGLLGRLDPGPPPPRRNCAYSRGGTAPTVLPTSP